MEQGMCQITGFVWMDDSDLIGVSRSGKKWTVAEAKWVIDSDRERCKGNLSKLERNIKAVRGSEVGPMCPQSQIELAIDILDIYDETRKRRNKAGQIAGIDIRGIIKHLRALYTRLPSQQM